MGVVIRYFDVTGAGAEYVDKPGGDYRIKAGSAFANLGLGAGEEQSAGVVMGGIFQQGIGVF